MFTRRHYSSSVKFIYYLQLEKIKGVLNCFSGWKDGDVFPLVYLKDILLSAHTEHTDYGSFFRRLSTDLCYWKNIRPLR